VAFPAQKWKRKENRKEKLDEKKEEEEKVAGKEEEKEERNLVDGFDVVGRYHARSTGT